MERRVVTWLMQGYAGSDIAEHCGTSRQNINQLFRGAVKKICEANDAEWKASTLARLHFSRFRGNYK